MSRLIMWNLITLDGFFEGAKPWDLSFHDVVWGDELEKIGIEQTGSADGLVFGRATFEGMAAHWPTAKGPIAEIMNSIPKFVCSRTLQSVDWNNSTILSGDAADEVAKLKGAGSKDLLVFGSANLSETFTRNGLFDEVRLVVTPVILGSGKPLFGRDVPGPKLELLSSQRLKTGGVMVQYKPEENS